MLITLTKTFCFVKYWALITTQSTIYLSRPHWSFRYLVDKRLIWMCHNEYSCIKSQHIVEHTTRRKATCQSQEFHVTIIPVTSQWWQVFIQDWKKWKSWGANQDFLWVGDDSHYLKVLLWHRQHLYMLECNLASPSVSVTEMWATPGTCPQGAKQALCWSLHSLINLYYTTPPI